MKLRTICSILGAAAILVVLSWRLAPAMWSSNGEWQRTRQDDELIATAFASKDPTIGVVYLLKNTTDLSALLQNISALDGKVLHVDHSIDYVRAVVPTQNIYRALDVPRGDIAAVDLDLSYHSSSVFGSPFIEKPGDWVEPPNTRRVRAGIGSRSTRKFLEQPSPILHDLDADRWLRKHPTFDGRGVTIADVEMLPGLMIPELSRALSLHGKPVRKLVGMHIVIDPGDHSAPGNDLSLQWVDMAASVHGTKNVVYKGQRYELPFPGRYRIGLFNLIAVTKQTHWLNPKVLEPAIGDGIFPVLWQPSTGLVWVDTRRSHDFRVVRPLRDFNASGDWSYVGAMHSRRYPLLRPAVSFVVLEDPHRHAVAIGLGFGLHASGVVSSAAGNPMNARDPVRGIAPEARIASFEYQSYKLHSQAEALIAAFEDSQTDLVVYEWDSRIFTQFTLAQGWFMDALGERLVQKFHKPLFVPGSNEAALAAIEDGGLGPDVMAVGAWQSAASYQLYEGFEPATNVHKHWGGLTDGPGQDGAIKPDLLAPSGYLAADVRYFWDADLNRKQGLYTLPPGLVDFGGTSQATPTAAGAAALLLSGIKQEGLHIGTRTLVDALRVGARRSSQLAPYEEGNGLLDVAATWKILKHKSKHPDEPVDDVARVCSGEIRTAYWPDGSPNGGRGIYETVGWHPGDVGSRTLKFCMARKTSGAINTQLLSNDGTYRIAGTYITGDTFRVNLSIHPRQVGFHSAIVQLTDAGGDILGRGMVTIAAAASLDKTNHYSFEQKIMVPRPGYTATFVDVPKRTDALVIHAARAIPFGMVIQQPSGDIYNSVSPPYGQSLQNQYNYTIPEPVSGTWSILLVDIHDVKNGTRSVIPVEPRSVEVKIQVVRVDESSPAKSVFAKILVRGVGSVERLATASGRFPSIAPVLIPITVPKDVDALMVDLSGSDSWVDGYLFDCRKACAPFARIMGSASDKRLTLPALPPGQYELGLDDYNPSATENVLPRYDVSIFAYSRFPTTFADSSANSGVHAYEVDCDGDNNEVLASPRCGIFIARDRNPKK